MRCQKPAFTPFAKAKGVWLEVGDSMGHFMDVKLLSFSHHPKSILTLYPPLQMSNLVLRCQKPAFTPFTRTKGVWLEMGDNMGHFIDVKLLSFSHHPKSIITLYPPLQMSNLVLRCQKPAFTPFTRTKGVWLEMGDNMGHFIDVKLLSFSHHPKSILTLYPPNPCYY